MRASEEPNRSPDDSSLFADNPQLVRDIEDYCEALERGETPDRKSLLEKYPEVSAELADCLDGLEVVNRFVPRLQTPTKAAGAIGGDPTREIGSQILGDFRIVREIGRGGMGIVYEAEQVSLGRRVALKLLPFAAVLDSRQVQRFQNEARAAASLDHPNIVHVHAVGCERGVHYYAMQLIEGQTLLGMIDELRLLRRDGRGKESPSSSVNQEHFRSMASLAIQAADGLEHAHQLGVVHRDVKPSNLIVDGDGHLRIMDFGLAMTRTEGNLTMTGDLLGTLRYMSPEQVEGNRGVLDHRTDVYSLGITLYELLTLEPAVAASEQYEVIHRVREDDPRPPRLINRAIPGDLETIVLKAIAKEPKDRYSTAGELADDLRRFLQHKPIRARRPTLTTRVSKWTRRHRPLVWSGVTTLAITAIVLIASTIEVSKSYREEIQQRKLVEEREGELRHHLYASDMKVVYQTWKNADVARARELLLRHVPREGNEDLRGFEWYFLWRLCSDNTNVLEGHTGEVYHVVFSPDGKTVASASEDQTIRIWDVATHGTKLVLSGHEGDVACLAFSPDGKTLASSGDDGTIRLWDTASGKPLATLTGHGEPVFAVAFSPDGRTLASGGCDYTVRLWDAATGKEQAILRGHTDDIESLVFFPDGKTLATAGQDAVRTWRLPEGTPGEPWPDTQGTFSVAVSSQGDKAVTGCKDNRVKLWDMPEVVGQPSLEGHTEWVQCVAFSPNGRLVASASKDGTVRLWDADTLQQVNILRGHLGRVWSVGFSPDGNTVVTGGADGTVRLWNANYGREYEAAPIANGAGFMFAPDGRLCTRTTDGPRLYEADQPPPHDPIDEGVSSRPAFSSNGRFVAVGYYRGKVILRDATTWKLIAELGEHPPDVRCVAISSDNRTVATVAEDSTVKLWDVESRRLRRILSIQPHEGSAIAFAPDRPTLAAALPDGTVRLWDVESGGPPEILRAHEGPVSCVVFSPLGDVLATSGHDRAVKLWNARTGENLATLLGHGDHVTALSFSPDGKTLASGGDDRSLRLWSVRAHQELLRLDAHTIPVTSVSFSPDGLTLASGGYGSNLTSELFLWRAAPRDGKSR